MKRKDMETSKRKFRLLNAGEIDCRINTITEKGFSILLYKDARCDMNILDETMGAENWQREHSRDNANCKVSIWDKEKAQWISKEDTGSESFTEKEKGLASDSFKRACFNWGIGRELYTAPFIWINALDKEVRTGRNGKPTTYTKLHVKDVSYDAQGNIKALIIADEKNRVRFEMGKITKPVEQKAARTIADIEAMFKNASTLQELATVWTGLEKIEQSLAFDLKETRKKEITNPKQ